jgi:hypothetical protein
MHVLEQPLVLDLVLQYAGPDQWLFLGGVGKAWAALYSISNIVLHKRPACRQRGVSMPSIIGKATSFAEARTSLARVLYVCACDAKVVPQQLLSLSKGAASCGSSDVLIWAKALAGSEWLAWHQELCMAAAAGNQLATLQWLRTSDPEQQWEVVEVATRAAECADLSMLEWFLEQQHEWPIESIESMSEGAARAADAIDKIAWLLRRFPADRAGLCYSFAVATIRCGAVESLKWLAAIEYDFIFEEYTYDACAGGHLAALRYLVEEAGCPWHVMAVRRNSVVLDSAEMLEWARSADEAVWTTAQLSELLSSLPERQAARCCVVAICRRRVAYQLSI